VHATSLNRGEVEDLSRHSVGYVPGWDVAGVVERSAADGTGPSDGERVVGLVRSGAWAQYVAVPTNRVASIPDRISFASAATLPTAGLTALHALRLGGLLLGKRVLITGANGGVGRMAVQLARASGAHVTALARDRNGAHDVLRRLGADEVREAFEGNYDVVIDGVGGDAFGQAIEHLNSHGVVVNLATPTPDATVTFRAGRLDRAPGAHIFSFHLPSDLGSDDRPVRDLALLTRLLLDQRLESRIELERPWQDVSGAMSALLNREIAGKAVLLID
jgi:NADPH:quinone reductase